MIEVHYRRARLPDLPVIIQLLQDDVLGKQRQKPLDNHFRYIKEFNSINSDLNQYLVVGEWQGQIVATCHATLMHTLTFSASVLLNIEAVRVSHHCRNQHIRKSMLMHTIDWGKKYGARIVQLSTDK